MNYSNVVEMDGFTKKELEKELIESITNACNALSDVENIASDLELDIDAREMLNALEHQLRLLTPKVYS